MSSTELLYISNSYLKEFDAKVVRSGPRFVILNRTAFYPHSGGQPSDKGLLLYNSNYVSVFKVMKRGSDIFHYIKGVLPIGAAAHGIIDWDARFLNMRLHSAEHLLSGIFERAAAGPKVYSDLTRIEFKPSDLDEEGVNMVEEEFNRAVKKNIPIRVYYTARGDIEDVGDERKRSFLEKIPRNVDRLRMVEIQGYDINFCFGTHVRSTDEIGSLSELELKKSKRQRRTVFFQLK